MPQYKREIEDKIAEFSRVIQQITEIVEERKWDKYVPIPVRDFIDYVNHCTTVAEGKFTEIETQIETDLSDKIYKVLLRDLSLLQEHFGHLHSYLKWVIDVSILESPSPFLIILNEILQQCYPNGRVIATRGDAINFSYEPLYRLNMTIPSEKIKNLAMVFYPFSEHGTVFKNLILFHEIGHLIYSRTDVVSSMRATLAQIDEEILKFLEKESKDDLPILQNMQRSMMSQWIQNWWEECFADAFAISVAGPSYFFACFKMYNSMPEAGMKTFYETHPAHYYRMTRLYNILSEEGWVEELHEKPERVFRWVKERDLALSPPDLQVSASRFVFSPNKTLMAACYLSFHKTVDILIKKAREVAGDARYDIKSFQECRQHITGCLENIIPPSLPSRKEDKPPDPISILNASIIFHLEDGVKRWIVKSKKEINRKTDYEYYKKLNQLVLKAIEDCLIVRGWGN